MKTERGDPTAPVLVLGIGNRLLSDDGVGLKLLEMLRREHGVDERVDFVDGGTQGMALVGLLENRSALLLLDAVASEVPGSPGARPGRIHVVWRPESSVDPRGFGAHGGNASELLACARLVGALPERVRMVGIEPAEVRTGIGLSPAVRRALPAAVVIARGLLRALCVEPSARGGVRCTS